MARTRQGSAGLPRDVQNTAVAGVKTRATVTAGVAVTMVAHGKDGVPGSDARSPETLGTGIKGRSRTVQGTAPVAAGTLATAWLLRPHLWRDLLLLWFLGDRARPVMRLLAPSSWWSSVGAARRVRHRHAPPGAARKMKGPPGVPSALSDNRSAAKPSLQTR